MAIEHCDNWDIYGRNAALMFNGIWASGLGFSGGIGADPDGVSTGSVLYPGYSNDNSGGQVCRYALQSGNVTTAGVAERVWLSVLPSTNNAYPVIAEFCDAGNNPWIRLGVNSTGGLTIFNPQLGTSVSTSVPVITANAWWHVETKVVVDGDSSTVEVRIEGTPVQFGGESSWTTTISQPVAQLAWSSINAFTTVWTSAWYLKDVVFWNGNGARNNDFLGSVIVYSQKANGDVAAPWGLTGAATATAVLNTAPPQDSTIYASAPYPDIPAQMEVSLTTLPTNVTTVRALMTVVRAKKVDGGDGNLQNGLISDSVQGDGVDRPITAAATYWRDIFETDPATDDTWTVNAANNAHLTINRTV